MAKEIEDKEQVATVEEKDTVKVANKEKTVPDKDAVDELGVPLALKEVMAKKRKADAEVQEEAKKERMEKAAEKDEPAEDIKTETEEVSEPEKGAPAGEKEEYEEVEIDPRLVAAGKAKGWSDEKIIEQAEKDESVLVDLADAQDVLSAQRKSPEPASKEKEEKPTLSKIELDKEATKKLSDEYGDDVVNKVIAPLADRLNEAIDTINTLRGGVEQFTESQEREVGLRRINVANEIFDKAAETFPVLGKTEELPRLEDGSYNERNPAVRERGKIWKTARMFHDSNGGSFGDAMKESLQWYGGGNEDALTRKVITKLDKQAKGHLARPTAKRVTPSYETKEEEGTAIVRGARERAKK